MGDFGSVLQKQNFDSGTKILNNGNRDILWIIVARVGALRMLKGIVASHKNVREITFFSMKIENQRKYILGMLWHF